MILQKVTLEFHKRTQYSNEAFVNVKLTVVLRVISLCLYMQITLGWNRLHLSLHYCQRTIS